MHISISGGGARGISAAAFFERLEASAEGRRWLESCTHWSGVSAGALVATPLAMGISAKVLKEHVDNSGWNSRWYYPKALATLIGWRDAMYDGQQMYHELVKTCKDRQLRAPLSIAVTDQHMQQKSLTYTCLNSIHSIANCAVASASVPGVFAARRVAPLNGLCLDGGAVRSTFNVDAIIASIRSGANVTLIHLAPWPQNPTIESTAPRRSRLFDAVFNTWNNHGLEFIQRELGRSFQFQDGVFQFQNVLFIAPTSAQFVKSGGRARSGQLWYKPRSRTVEQLTQEGHHTADCLLRFLKQSSVVSL